MVLCLYNNKEKEKGNFMEKDFKRFVIRDCAYSKGF